MDWLKKNLIFVVSGVVALALVGLAGFYLFSQINKNKQIASRLSSEQQRLQTLTSKKNHPGNDEIDNVKLAEQDINRLQNYKQDLLSSFNAPTPPPQTEQAFKSELAKTLGYIEAEGGKYGLSTPTNFNLSFTAQRISFRFASNSLPALTRQLADLREITRILVDARVNSIESVRRVPVSDDDSGPNAVAEEYLTDYQIKTNEFTGAVVYPYKVDLRCFSEELGRALEGFSETPYSILVKTVVVEPTAIREVKTKKSRESRHMDGMDLVRALQGATSRPGVPGRFGTDPTSSSSGRDDRMSSRYGGSRDDRMSSRYGGGTSSRSTTQQGPNLQQLRQLGVDLGEPQQTEPETIIFERPLQVTLGLEVIHMPADASADSKAN